ncbi:ATP-dependent nuclease [Campylobacter suis]|uniref:AAA+ ATPase domain-containing protein n=1 Tax=Campylobacter suis TaxID=2790657 RepID=A0ABN7K8W9_9BACT|nr:AAA family ATPase [Campylobacter suis]CAD7288254.1 hypothetical protein LMG8286_01222 [Campylobacter suis]
MEQENKIFIEKIEIKDFRAFSGITQEGESKIYSIELGEHITCISGHNGIGKSTILAMLSNCGELKKQAGILLNGDKFTGEYSSIVKYDKDYDTSGEKCSIHFHAPDSILDSYELKYPKILDFRAAVQGGNRYRLLPKKTDERFTESKIEWPTYYLGLSRLYPVGESDDVNVSEIKVDAEIKDEMFQAYTSILSSDIEKINPSFINPSDAKKKKGVGIKTDKYGALSNSSGQDNLGQILMAVFSFKNLKNTLEKKENNLYYGGILLIDEIDATLHPAAQNKLFDFLYKKAKEIGLQIVFTTHSLSLLDHIIKRGTLNDKNTSLVVQYLTNARKDIEILKNPTIEQIERDLLILSGKTKEKIKINVLTEDEVGRWFLEKIIESYNLNVELNFLDCTFGCGEIAKLINSSQIFNNFLVILDPDVSNGKSKQDVENNLKKSKGYWKLEEPTKEKTRCIFYLPGEKPVESIMWEYVYSSPKEHDMYFDESLESHGIRKRNLLEMPSSMDMSVLENQKKWFYDNQYILDIIVKYWIEDNKNIADAFVSNFKFEYNKIAEKVRIDKI